MSKTTFFFYDLETSGFSPREARIMQFAGQRVSLELEPIGEPANHLIKITDDILPDVGAVLLTGITPQMTKQDGITEAEFLSIFHEQIATPGTIFVGFNNIRFDDEFLRFLNYRNFYDAYEWHWSDNRSRWDLLDVVRMTRALRPKGIEWPFASDGAPANRLEGLAKQNNLIHDKAHDALSDVHATIALAQLIRTKQPRLFEHLLTYRDKKLIADLVSTDQPFIYTSGKYPSKFLHTTAVARLGEHPKKQGVFVFDLRANPEDTLKLTVAEMAEQWKHYCAERPCPHPRFPVKTMQFNRCPAVAPLSVLDADSSKRLELVSATIQKHSKLLNKHRTELHKKITAVTEQLDKAQAEMFSDEQLAESALYDGFMPAGDKQLAKQFINDKPQNMLGYAKKFSDNRLKSLAPLYISKNYPAVQTDDLRAHWEKFRVHKLMNGGPKSRAALYFQQLAKAADSPSVNGEQRYLLEELQLWGQSILPIDETA